MDSIVSSLKVVLLQLISNGYFLLFDIKKTQAGIPTYKK